MLPAAPGDGEAREQGDGGPGRRDPVLHALVMRDGDARLQPK